MTDSPTADHAHPTKQARSQQTLDRLIAAVEGVLADEGLEGATVPAIAKRAGLSVGVVYRRFPDKDTMMRAVYESFFARSRALMERGLDPAHWEGKSLVERVRMLVGGTVAGYRLQRGILRALLLYAQTHPDPEFRRRADELNAETFRRIAGVLLPFRDEMAHPNPEAAVQFALTALASTVRLVVLSEPPWKLSGIPEDRLADELARMFLGYLGVALPSEARPPRGRRRRSATTVRR